MYCYALCTQSGHDIGLMYIDIDSDHTEKCDITDTLIQITQLALYSLD